MNKLHLIAAVAVAASVSTPLLAKDHSWPIGKDEYHVYYRDLNINMAPDRAEMLRRVEVAATRLCSDRMALKVDIKGCVADLVAQSAPSSPTLRLALSERNSAHYAAR